MIEREVCDERGLRSEDIRRLLDEGVANAAAHAYAHSAFYRDLFDSTGLRPEQVASAEDLSRLVPVTTKDDLSANGRRMWAARPGRIVDIVTTSGTTGEPTPYPMTESDLRRLGYNECLSFICAGLTSQDVVVLGVTLELR